MITINKILLILFLIPLCLYIFIPPIFAQPKDSVKVHKHSPKKAALMSTFIPGLGQVYNRKYWKLPILYGGAATLVYFEQKSNNNYKTNHNAYIARMKGDSTVLPSISVDNLLANQTLYRRNRDLMEIFIGLVYILNIVDAAVDAHLYHFDVSDNLSFNLDPAILRYGKDNSTTAGLTLSLRIK